MIPEETALAGLYIHVPFCKSRCFYCDFYSVTDTGLIPRFLKALFKEIDVYREEFSGFDTLYLGGGTPSLLALHQIEALLEKVHKTFTILGAAEITIEVNPADWKKNDLKALQGMGINRINIGVQSLNENELTLLGRRHNRGQAISALEDAQAAGFTNIGIDLIYDLPGQTLAGWQETLNQALDFAPDHLSCYELEIKPGTPLGQRYELGEFPYPSQDLMREFFMRTSEFLEFSGYIHYEVSNFAKGMERASRHNRKYWDHTPYLGLGPSAHSFKAGRRWWNHSSVRQYLDDLAKDRMPVEGSEELTNEQLHTEALFLGLRTKQGIDLERHKLRYGHDLMQEKGPVLEQWGREGLIEIEGGFVRPKRAGMAVADGLAQL